jgi:hypothetical protein
MPRLTLDMPPDAAKMLAEQAHSFWLSPRAYARAVLIAVTTEAERQRQDTMEQLPPAAHTTGENDV